MLGFYMAHGDYEVGISLTEKLLQDVVERNFGTHQLPFHGKVIDFTAPFKRLTVSESLVEIGGFTHKQIAQESIDALLKEQELAVHGAAGYGTKLFALFEHAVEKKIVQPTFIVGYPIEVSPLAKRDPKNADQAARFELFICGMEFANGFTELNDPQIQYERFMEQVAQREGGNEEAMMVDHDFVTALEYGLPPTGGWGMGIDRLVMLMTNSHNIREVIAFPTLKPLRD
jgi:lysyl-tRNA synthetase class 2